MQLTIMRPANLTIEGIDIYIPKSCVHDDDDVPDVFVWGDDELHIRVTDAGYVVGWVNGQFGRLSLKVCDAGTYSVFGQDDDGFAVEYLSEKYYVPACVPGEDGDYIDLDIDATGQVKNWDKFWTPANVRRSFFSTGDE